MSNCRKSILNKFRFGLKALQRNRIWNGCQAKKELTYQDSTTASYFADHNCPILALKKCIFPQSANPLEAGTCTFPSYSAVSCDLIRYIKKWLNELLFEPP
jgi:hypothetical protein